MPDPKESERPPGPAQPDDEKPRRWEPPRMVTGPLFETHSLACAKTTTMPTLDCSAAGDFEC